MMSCEKACFFTGHRPNKLGGWDYNHPLNNAIRNRLLRPAIINMIENYGVETFIFGGALGIDQFAFEVCYSLKHLYDIELILVIPFRNYYTSWVDQSDIDRCHSQIERSDYTIYTDETSDRKFNTKIGEYQREKMLVRNEQMVNASIYGIAVWDGSIGGTSSCIKYAKKHIRKENLHILDLKKFIKEYYGL